MKLAELIQDIPLSINNENTTRDEKQAYERLLEEFHQISSSVERGDHVERQYEMVDAQIDLILDDLIQGRKTIDGLVAQKKLYEGGNALITSLVHEHSDHPIGQAFILLYESICIVLHLLLTWFPHLFEDDEVMDVEEIV